MSASLTHRAVCELLIADVLLTFSIRFEWPHSTQKPLSVLVRRYTHRG